MSDEDLHEKSKKLNYNYSKNLEREVYHVVPLEQEAPKKRKKIIYNNFILFFQRQGFWGFGVIVKMAEGSEIEYNTYLAF